MTPFNLFSTKEPVYRKYVRLGHSTFQNSPITFYMPKNKIQSITCLPSPVVSIAPPLTTLTFSYLTIHIVLIISFNTVITGHLHLLFSTCTTLYRLHFPHLCSNATFSSKSFPDFLINSTIVSIIGNKSWIKQLKILDEIIDLVESKETK